MPSLLTTILSILTVITFGIQFRNNNQLNEARFIMDLNNQFISCDKLNKIEWELEKYYADYILNVQEWIFLWEEGL